ncbi:HAD hydrolase-like protein [Halanaerobium sp. Z-7514]|uniref:HAD hydrolase-like protein n=1 Tax=Halanaerobium polyolivorans TaxID=2886943 RepID=A0AAW4WST9_9FIRM|nr:HAD hydrolase-like protein [Halanaerobium polyolivorans]MCC3144177.1 HAD hydrolase-like protein [Halanaerobium polyolivorans]
MNKIKNFKKEANYLVCIDSDGSAIDTMTEKHLKCFGPVLVEVWGLNEIKKEFLNKWNKINLYSSTRGINRFRGLVESFKVLKAEGIEMPEIKNLENWVKNSEELSNPALEKEIEKREDNTDLKLALKWSQELNKAISILQKDISKVFMGVKASLEKMYKKADLAVVSSANNEALLDEWHSYELDNYVKIILGQEAGAKAENIKELMDKGYDKDKVLMIGDALGDLRAAEENNVLFYPILAGKEEKSWQLLFEEASDKFFAGEYKGDYEAKLIDKFKSVLS